MFNRAVKVVLALEGGYSDDPADSGRKTQYGITEVVARDHGYSGDMRNLPLDTALGIYHKDYWDACRCDDLPWPLSLYVFDCAVNQGPTVAKRLLQQTLGTVQDGYLGPTTIRLAQDSKQWHWSLFMSLRAIRYFGTRDFPRFGAGWLNRLFTVVGTANL